MKKYQLGEFEEIVMLTIAILYKGAYGVAIKKEIEERLSRNVSMGAMHTALVRLEDKGYIESHDGEATDDRMGRPKKYFQITALGKKQWNTHAIHAMNCGEPFLRFHSI